jgi:diguanylate cyclase (GGDEF)-like protein/PAS domain S-box-containing protein
MDNQIDTTITARIIRRVLSCGFLCAVNSALAATPSLINPSENSLLITLAVLVIVLAYAIYLRWRLQVLQADRQLILQNAPCAVVVWDKHGCVLSWNHKAEEIFGWSSEEVIGKSFEEFLLPTDEVERLSGFIKEHIVSGARSVSENWNLTKSGNKIYCRWLNQSMRSSSSMSRAMCVSMAENITEHYALQKSLQVRNVAFDAAPNPIVITDHHGVINYINPAFTQLLGYLNDEVVGKHASCVWDNSEVAIYAEIQSVLSQGRIWRGELLRNRKDGKQVVHSVAISPVFDQQGKVSQFVSMEMDVSSYKVLQQQLEYAAFFDELTRLPNRAMFLDYFDRILANAQRNNQTFALFFIDLNGFKEINDTHGHEAGDKVLQILAVRLRDRLRASDIVARLGGDEFTMLATGINDRDTARQLAEKIISEVSYPIALDGGSCQLGASVGIALFPEDAIDRDGLLSCADKAMYRVKRSPDHDYLFYDQLATENQ